MSTKGRDAGPHLGYFVFLGREYVSRGFVEKVLWDVWGIVTRSRLKYYCWRGKPRGLTTKCSSILQLKSAT